MKTQILKRMYTDYESLYFNTQNIAIDYSELHASPEYDASTMCIHRGGTKAVESTQAEEQTKREAGILSVQYNTVREIPPSPEEPAEESVDGASGQWEEIPVPENFRVDVRLTFLYIFLGEDGICMEKNICAPRLLQKRMNQSNGRQLRPSGLQTVLSRHSMV